MKRFIGTDLISISSPKEEKTGKMNEGYSREFQAMLDSIEEEDYTEDASHTTEKKRRLTPEQVKALEKNFEVENKLEPERKIKLAEEVGLQPRQVAIWFQNRRARWKTKQLERDHGTLKANYEALKLDYNNLEQENAALTLKVKELKAKLREENSDSINPVKETHSPVSETDNNISVQSKNNDFNENNTANGIIKENSNLSSSHQFLNWIQLSDSRPIWDNSHQVYQTHPVKLEEQSLFSTEESCNFFSVDQAPTLHWYFPEQLN